MATITLQIPVEVAKTAGRQFFGAVTGNSYTINPQGQVTVDTADSGGLLAQGWKPAATPSVSSLTMNSGKILGRASPGFGSVEELNMSVDGSGNAHIVGDLFVDLDMKFAGIPGQTSYVLSSSYDSGSGGNNKNVAFQFNNWNNDGYGDGLGFYYGRGTGDAPLAAQDGDILSQITFGAFDGTGTGIDLLGIQAGPTILATLDGPLTPGALSCTGKLWFKIAGGGTFNAVLESPGWFKMLSGIPSTSPGTGSFVSVGGLGVSGDIFGGGGVVTATVAVASLPAATAGNKGMRMMVNNATATAFWTIVAGGGANTVPVTSDGTNWRIG